MSAGNSHLDPTAEIAAEAVKTKAVKGVFVLTGRTFLLSLLSLIATGFLTVFLEPGEFGVFWIVSAVVNFLAYFSDIGLAAALIQKKERPEEEELKTTFSVQQVLVIGLLLALFLATPLITRVYSLSAEGRLLFFALGFSLFLSSLKTIPSVLLERDLEFGKLVIPQVLENLVYSLAAVVLAWQGFGLRSFTYAVILRGLVGLAAIYLIRPWLPGFAFSKASIKKLLVFGLPYQANTLLATIKDDGMTALLGGILGSAGVGFLGWAQKWGQAPLRFFMDHVIKVTFPAFSRLQERKELLRASLTKSLFFICFLVFPTLAGLLLLSPLLVRIIPRYEKWTPALIPLFFIGINTFFAAFTTQLTNFLNAIGKIKITFKLMVMWTILTWALIPLLALKYGVVGAAGGYALVGASSIVAVIIARKFVEFSLTDAVVKPFVATLIMSSAVFFLKVFLPVGLTSVWLLIAAGGVVYLLVIYILVGGGIREDVRKGIQAFLKK